MKYMHYALVLWLLIIVSSISFPLQNDQLSIVFTETAPKSKITVAVATHNMQLVVISSNTAMNGVPVPDEVIPSDDEYFQSVEIFEKYLRNESTFCVNISGKMRSKMYRRFGYSYDKQFDVFQTVHFLKNTNTTKEKLFHIFDEPRKETFALLSGAFFRFKTTEQYEIIRNKLSEDGYTYNSDKSDWKLYMTISDVFFVDLNTAKNLTLFHVLFSTTTNSKHHSSRFGSKSCPKF